MGRPQLSTQRRPRSPEALLGTAVLAAISQTQLIKIDVEAVVIAVEKEGRLLPDQLPNTTAGLFAHPGTVND